MMFGRYTLALILTIPAVATQTGWSQDEAETKAIAAIEELGGSVQRIAMNVEDKEVALHLADKEITDEALAHLPAIKNVVWLNLRGTKITDAGLQYVAQLTGLTRLHLEKTEVGDAGVEALAGLGKLEYLNLYGTKVTDAGIAKLQGIKTLRKLYLWQTGVTDAGANQLTAAIPELDINRGAELKPVPPPVVPLANGRYVRVRFPAPQQTISLAEVEVIGVEGEKPLHREGEATQSSTVQEAQAARAIDGNAETAFDKGSVSQTDKQDYPWWQVDLKSMQPIAQIRVHARADDVGAHLVGVIVEILDEGHQVVWATTIGSGEKSQIHKFANEKPAT